MSPRVLTLIRADVTDLPPGSLALIHDRLGSFMALVPSRVALFLCREVTLPSALGLTSLFGGERSSGVHSVF